MGGRNAANAIMLAVLEREMSGLGQYVDLSIAEAVATEPPFQFTHYSFLGIISRRTRRVNVPVDGDFLPCRDGYITMASSGGNTWEELAVFLDSPELLDDRFADRLSRSNHAEELNELMVSRLSDRDKHDVFDAGMKNGFVFGVAQTPQGGPGLSPLGGQAVLPARPAPRYGRAQVHRLRIPRRRGAVHRHSPPRGSANTTPRSSATGWGGPASRWPGCDRWA